MKLQADRIEGQNAIARHGAAGIVVNGVEYRRSVLVSATSGVRPWAAGNFAELTEANFDEISALTPELVIFGSGPRIRFVHPSLLRPLLSQRIGVETMDTAAACRTYNVLLAEGRGVVAALLFAPAQPGP